MLVLPLIRKLPRQIPLAQHLLVQILLMQNLLIRVPIQVLLVQVSADPNPQSPRQLQMLTAPEATNNGGGSTDLRQGTAPVLSDPEMCRQDDLPPTSANQPAPSQEAMGGDSPSQERVPDSAPPANGLPVNNLSANNPPVNNLPVVGSVSNALPSTKDLQGGSPPSIDASPVNQLNAAPGNNSSAASPGSTDLTIDDPLVSDLSTNSPRTKIYRQTTSVTSSSSFLFKSNTNIILSTIIFILN